MNGKATPRERETSTKIHRIVKRQIAKRFRSNQNLCIDVECRFTLSSGIEISVSLEISATSSMLRSVNEYLQCRYIKVITAYLALWKQQIAWRSRWLVLFDNTNVRRIKLSTSPTLQRVKLTEKWHPNALSPSQQSTSMHRSDCSRPCQSHLFVSTLGYPSSLGKISTKWLRTWELANVSTELQTLLGLAMVEQRSASVHYIPMRVVSCSMMAWRRDGTGTERGCR